VTDRVFILGAGRAGLGLARAFRASGIPLAGIHGRHAVYDEVPVTAGALTPALGDATAVLVAVRDGQMESALEELAAGRLAGGTIVLHLSGSAEPAGLAALRAHGHAAGTFHPLVPLADPARAAELLRGAWIGIDGDARAMDTARRLAGALGARTLVIPPGAKARYHAAAVFASNFPTVLAATAARLMEATGIEAGAAWSAVGGLMAAAASNLRWEAPSTALTGPVARGDVDTVRRHLDALASDPDARAAYVLLSRGALPLARAQGADPARLQAIERLLA
jgi:predicted short-subunit dehydrogenase-like oxidoreductase (DUF2520 family)